MKLFVSVSVVLLTASAAFADSLNCDLTAYSASDGLTATVDQDLLVVVWDGQGGVELRARYGIEGRQPLVRDLAVRRQGGQWSTLGQNLAGPEPGTGVRGYERRAAGRNRDT